MTTLVIVLVLCALLGADTWFRRHERRKAAELSEAADEALRLQRRVARRRASAASIPVPLGREDTTPVFALVPRDLRPSRTEYREVRRAAAKKS